MELRAETAPTNTLRAPERRKRNEPHLTTRKHRQEDLTAPHLSKRKQHLVGEFERPALEDKRASPRAPTTSRLLRTKLNSPPIPRIGGSVYERPEQDSNLRPTP